MAREELTVNIIIKKDHIFLAAKANDCDPKMTTLKGDLTAALARVPSFVDESNKAWDMAAHNPKTIVPEPVATTTPARTATTSHSSTASKPAASKQPAQPNFF